MTRNAQGQFQKKEVWFAEIGGLVDIKASAGWSMRTDSGKQITIAIQNGRLVQLLCGFRDIRGTMAVLSRCDMIMAKRIEAPQGTRKTLLETPDLMEWLEKARTSETIQELPSERLSFRAGRTEPTRLNADAPHDARSIARTTPHKPRPTSSEEATPRVGRTEATELKRKHIPYVRRTAIVTLGFAVVMIITMKLLGIDLPQPKKLWNIAWSTVAEEEIREDTTWDGLIVVESRVNVEGEAVLTIKPGTRIEAQPGAEITVERDAQLIAMGTRNEPIVFTSKGEGGWRESGDWAGIRLLGNARVDADRGTLRSERIAEGHDGYGGKDDHNKCGQLRFVRIEFAGSSQGAAIALKGCGSRTWLEYVQVHRPQGRGISIAGGSGHLRNIVVSQATGVGVETRRGWKGSWQNVIVQMHAERGGLPVRLGGYGEREETSEGPTLWNTTLIGGREATNNPGLEIGGGQRVQASNTLIAGINGPIMAVIGEVARRHLEEGRTKVRHIAVSGTSANNANEENDAAAATIRKWIRNPENRIVRTNVRMLGSKAWLAEDPDFTPIQDSAANQGDTPRRGFDANDYCGAVRPGSRTAWTWKWTAFPTK